MIGSAVGLGNIWRFPYILYTNGNGSFMIPYLIALFLLGFSFLFVEYALGYKYKTSIIKIFKSIRDKFEYIGWAVLLLPFLVILYYTCVLGWDLIYLFLSFTKGWGSNPNYFFTNTLLQTSAGINGLFHFVPIIIISIVIIWLIMWLIIKKELNKGIGRINKILMPILLITITIIVLFSLTLPGASVGYSQIFNPNWASLTDLNVWLSAFGQIVFTLNIGCACVMTYSSYLPEGSKLSDNAIIVGASNSAFEIFNAIGVFSILGFMATSTGIGFNNLIIQGPGLAFVAFPQVFNIMGLSAYLIGPLFFISILFAGISSAISMTEPMTDALTVKFGIERKKSATILCIIGLGISLLLFSNSAGSIILEAVDTVLNNIILISLLIIQCILLTWIYKFDNLIEVINENSTIKLGQTWKYVIKYVLPILLSIFCINGIYTYIVTAKNLNLIILGLTIIVMLIIPLILTKIPTNNKEFYKPLDEITEKNNLK